MNTFFWQFLQNTQGELEKIGHFVQVVIYFHLSHPQYTRRVIVNINEPLF